MSMVGSIEEFQIRHMARMAGSGSMGMARRMRGMLSSDFEGSHAVSRRCVKKNVWAILGVLHSGSKKRKKYCSS